MIYHKLLTDARFGEKKLALLVDPDKQQLGSLAELGLFAAESGVDYILLGGSLLLRDQLDDCVHHLKTQSQLPIILFPGSTWQISSGADALLFLSLISGRNAELLIGQQVLAAPLLKDLQLEVLSTGYMLIDGGNATSVCYISQTMPIPANKPEIAVATALAGKYIGMKMFYLDAGSGAHNTVPFEMIRAVRKATELPLFVGGGIRTPDQAAKAAQAGADIIVVGTAIEHDQAVLPALCQAVHSANHIAEWS